MGDSDELDRAGADRGDRLVKIEVEPGKPIKFSSEMPANDATAPGAEEARRIVRALKSYRAAIHELVSTRYSNVADGLPWHLRQPAKQLREIPVGQKGD